MRSMTGIELGPDFCMLVRVRRGRAGTADVLALHAIERTEWPTQELVRIDALRELRRSRKFPRRARVVAWELPAGSTLRDPAAVALLRPLVAAGFRVDALVAPSEALALLAGSGQKRTGTEPAVWAAVNVYGAAIAVVRGTELLFSRALPWSYSPALTGSRAQLLQRYSLVAQLAAEVRHAIAAVRLPRGEKIGNVVTCGDLPDLRSLTMPLTEELDLEVETLDSIDGVRAVGSARLQHFAESAAAIRLACAAALARPASPANESAPWVRIAAAAALLATLAWGVLALRGDRAGESARQGTQGGVPVASNAGRGAGHSAPSGGSSATQTPRAAAPGTEAPNRPRGDEGHTPPSATPTELRKDTRPIPLPAPVPATPVPATRPPVAQDVEPSPISTIGQSPAPSAQSSQPIGDGRQPTARPSAAARPPAAQTRMTLPPPPSPSQKTLPSQSAAAPVKGTGVHTASRSTTLVPLREALPRVDSILIDQDRRLAVVEGAVVRVGDKVGTRVVVQIERDGLVLREASGLLLRVPLRAKSG